MAGRAHKRPAEGDACDSQEKKLKFPDGDGGTSKSEENGSSHWHNETDTLEYTLDYSSEEDLFGATAKYDTTQKYSLSKSGSQATVVLSDNGDDTDDMDQSNNVTVNLETSINGDHSGNTTTNLGATSDADIIADTPPPRPRQLYKDTSLIHDADFIAGIIPNADDSVVLNTLALHRTNPNRLHLVTGTILDRSIESETEVDAADGFDPQAGQAAAAENGKSADAAAAASTDHGTATEEDGVYNDVKKVVEKLKARDPHIKPNPAEVYLLLVQNSHLPDRVDRVLQSLLKNGLVAENRSQAATASTNPTSDDLFEQATVLATEFPREDPSAIYDLLEKTDDQDRRLAIVREKLKAIHKPGPKAPSTPASSSTPAPKTPLVKEDSISGNPLVHDDPVFRDMRTISKMFPEKDQNELYAMVEAHYYKDDRVQVVIEELLKGETNSQDISVEIIDIESPTPVPSRTSLQAGRNTPVIGDNILQDDFTHLRNIFPDCDPNYIYERLDDCKDKDDRVTHIATEMFERKNYPRLKDLLEKQTKEARRKRLHGMNFTVQEFLAKFPDPTATFTSTEKEMKGAYLAHVDALIKHEFPDFKTSYIAPVVTKHKSHLFPILKEMETTRHDILANGGQSKKLRDMPKEEPLKYPQEPDELFFYELWFSRNDQKVKDHFKKKEAERQAKVEKARARSELYECTCCFEDELLFEEMNVCGDGHLFCRQCLARSVEAAFGEGKTSFPCLTGTCEQQIPLSVLKDILPSSMFSKVLRRLQEEEVRQAGIPDLVDCPFCSFATIMPNPDDKVFTCLNPECLKDSCRLCREPNHVPLKCNEVEKQKETDMRTFIEKRVTEAMLRKCHRCGKYFVKDVGCNKMTCICGATSCYICRATDIDYNHFTGNKCQEGDMQQLHQQEMEKAAKEAREEYLKEHPEAADVELKYDPSKHIQKAGSFGTKGDYDGGSEPGDSSDEDDFSDDDEDDSLLHDDEDDDIEGFLNDSDDDDQGMDGYAGLFEAMF